MEQARVRWFVVAVVVAALVVASAGFALGRYGTGGGDAAWGAEVDALCVRAAERLVELGPPGSFDDGDVIRTWAGEAATVFEDLGGDIEDLGGERSAGVAEVVRARASLYRELAAPQSELPRLDVVDRYGRELEVLDGRARELLEPVGSTSCSRLGQPGSVAPGKDEFPNWLAALDGACDGQLGPLRALDDELGAAVVDQRTYSERASQAVGELADELARSEPPVAAGLPADLRDRWTALVSAVRATGEALGVGDLGRAREQSRRWAGAGESLGLGACAVGVPAGVTTPSGALSVPELPSYGGGAVAGGTVGDSEAVLRFLLDAGLPGTGSDPGTSFNVPVLVDELFGGSLAAAGGDRRASADTVSVSAAGPVDSREPAGPANPWLVGVAVADSGGGCTFGVLYGYPRLTGSSWSAGGPECSGDRAREAYVPQEPTS